MILSKDHLRKENMKKEKEQIFHTKEIRNFMALSLTQNALFMVGIHGTNVLITHKVRVTSPVEPMAITLIMENMDKAEEAFLILAMATAAVAMATVAVLVSMLFRLKLQLCLKCQQQFPNNTTLTALAQIPNGDGMK
jgi:hypothetical protein